MKKAYLFSMLLCIILANMNIVFGQIESIGDTLKIGPNNYDGSPVGALNHYIAADVTATGDRLHSVYKLQRGATYILTERIVADFPLTIVADRPDAANRPPIIRTGLKEDGSTVLHLFEFYDDVTFKNLMITGITPTGDSPSEWMILNMNESDKRYTFDGCFFENIYSWWGFIEDWGSHSVHKYTNCYFRNFGEPGGVWNGAILGCEPPADSLIYRNCTFFDFDCCALSVAEDKGALYTEIDHCTFANSVVHQFILNKPVIAKVTNNIFFNCNAYSEGPGEVSRHSDQEIHGIIHFLQFQPTLLDSTWGDLYDYNGDGTLTEDERVYELKNNVWYYSEPVKNYWASYDSVFEQSWYCNAVKEFYVNNLAPKDWIIHNLEGNPVDTLQMAAHPFFVEENTMNVDPQFENIGNSDEMLAQHCISVRKIKAGESAEPVYWFYDQDENPTTFEWPLSESLKPTNPQLINAGTDGKTIGSLLWWGEYDGVQENNEVVPADFTLEQNYPNPFNPTTSINYSIFTSGHVELKIFNVLGSEIATLVNKVQTTGNYQVSYDASSLGSGVYFYRISAGKQTLTKKMIVIK